MRRSRVVLGIVVLAAVLGTLAPAGSAGSCPDPSNPRTCGKYERYGNLRWRSGRYNVVTIPYWINPSQPWMPEDRAVAAIRAAFQTWADWNPRIRPLFLGATDRHPVPLDGHNVFGFGQHPLGGAVAHVWCEGSPNLVYSQTLGTQGCNGYIGEADITFSVAAPWTWISCRQANDSCTNEDHLWMDAPLVGMGLLGRPDLQSIATHEIGHVIGLHHPDVANSALTMDSGAPSGHVTMRQWSTLALGDVLGAKAIYPWSCPPKTASASTKHRFRYLCPSITIFAP